MAELLDRVDSAEFVEWEIMYANDPWGPGRADQQAALVAMMIAAANRGKRSAAPKLADFLLYKPFQQETHPEMSEAERLIAGARAYNAAYRAKQKRRQRKAK